MKNAFIIVALLIYLPLARLDAQQLTPVEQGSLVQFHVVNHMIFKSTVTGTLKGLSGSITFNPANINDASIDVSAAVKTISTGIGMRDSHLKKDEYFDEQKFPLIKIKSQSISKGAEAGHYLLVASLSIKGITKTISVPFTAEQKNGGYLFKGQFEITRKDFNIGPDNSIEQKVVIDLAVEAK